MQLGIALQHRPPAHSMTFLRTTLSVRSLLAFMQRVALTQLGALIQRVALTQLGALALLVALAAGAPASAVDDWETFVSENGHFSVAMPTRPSEEQKKKWFPISSFVSTVYKSIVGHDIFGVNHTDIPGFALVFASDERVFQSSRKGFIEDSQAVEISYRVIELFGRDGRELIYEIPPVDGRPAQRGTAQMFFEGNRLYIFYAEVTDAVPATAVKRFFDSIQLLDPS